MKIMASGPVTSWEIDAETVETVTDFIFVGFIYFVGFPCSSVGKESACSAGDLGLIPGLGKSPGEGNDYPLQYSSCRIPRTEEPGRLQSMGPQRVGHNWATKHTGEKSKNFEPLCELFS